MSKKKKANNGVIKTRDLVAKMARGCVLNQHAPVMGDKTKYNRKLKHRRDFRNERDAPVFIYMCELKHQSISLITRIVQASCH